MDWYRRRPVHGQSGGSRYQRITTIHEHELHPNMWSYVWGAPMARSRTIVEFACTFLTYTTLSSIALTVGLLAMWMAFSYTVYTFPHAPYCTLGSVPDREYSGTGDCVLTVHLNTRCEEDRASGISTFSEMAGRWPHAASLLGGAVATNVFLTVVVCDVWLQKAEMLALSWVSFILFWGVVSTSQYDCDNQIFTAHAVLSGLLILSTAAYCYAGTTWPPPRGWSPWYLWTPLLALLLVAVLLGVAGYQTWSLGGQDDGGGSDYDYWRGMLALLEMVYFPLVTAFVAVFAWEVSDAMLAADYAQQHSHPDAHRCQPLPQPHLYYHPTPQRHEQRGQRAWRLILSRH